MPSELTVWRAVPPLSPSFYRRSAPVVARALLGKFLVTDSVAGLVVVRIVEVEAYLGTNDPASHTHRGMTMRNQAMFALGGTCYVYLSYGMHYCMNVVTGPAGRGEGVLLRAAMPIYNVPLMAARRGVADLATPAALRQLCSGPGKLTQALGVDLTHGGQVYATPALKIVRGPAVAAAAVGVSTRIGISKAKDLPLRFFLKNSPFLSKA